MSSAADGATVFTLDGYRQRRIARDERDVMSVRELAEYLALGLNTTYAYLSDGTIPAKRVGRRWIVSRARITAWIATSTEGA